MGGGGGGARRRSPDAGRGLRGGERLPCWGKALASGLCWGLYFATFRLPDFGEAPGTLWASMFPSGKWGPWRSPQEAWGMVFAEGLCPVMAHVGQEGGGRLFFFSLLLSLALVTGGGGGPGAPWGPHTGCERLVGRLDQQPP